MLHVTTGLLLLSNLSYFHAADILTFYEQVCQSNVTCTSQFCHKLCLDVKNRKK